MSKKSLSISLILLLLAIGAIEVFWWHGVKDGNNSNTAMALPNTLQDGKEGALVKVTYGANSFLFFSSILPALAKESTATEDVIVEGAQFIPNYLGPGMVPLTTIVGNRYLVLLDQNDLTYSVIDVLTKNTITHGTVAAEGSIAPDGTTSIASSLSASLDSLVAYILVRRGVVQNEPAGYGSPKQDSTAELWSIALPQGISQKLATFTAQTLPKIPQSISEFGYQLPFQAAQFRKDFLLTWNTKVDQYSLATATSDTVYSTPTELSLTTSVASNELNASVTQQDYATNTFTVYGLSAETAVPKKLATFFDAFYERMPLWDSSGTELLLRYARDGSLVRINIATTQQTRYSQTTTAMQPLAWFASDMVLLSEERAISPLAIEEPETALNFLQPFVTFSLKDGSLSYLHNHRSPHFIGVLTSNTQ